MVELLSSVMELTGTVGAAIILVSSGVCLAHSGIEAVETTSQTTSGTTRLLRSKMRRIVLTGNPATTESDSDGLEDVVLTYRKQYHLLRLLSVEEEEVFLHVVLARPQANLAMTRYKVGVLEQELLSDPVRLGLMKTRLCEEREAAEREFRRETVTVAPYIVSAKDTGSDEVPAYLCEDSVRRMLGLSPVNA